MRTVIVAIAVVTLVAVVATSANAVPTALLIVAFLVGRSLLGK